MREDLALLLSFRMFIIHGQVLSLVLPQPDEAASILIISLLTLILTDHRQGCQVILCLSVFHTPHPVLRERDEPVLNEGEGVVKKSEAGNRGVTNSII